MSWVAALIAGLAATLVLTALMYASPAVGMPKMDMIGMMGTMFTPRKGIAYVLGTFFHFMNGVILAMIYALVWTYGFGDPTWGWGLIFGAIHGVIALMSLPLMLKMHPRPPEMRPTVGLMMGHLVYGLIVAVVYASFRDRLQ